jgi:acetyltransferase
MRPGDDSAASPACHGAFTLKDGTVVRLRPIRPEDEPLMVGFHEQLSDRTVHLRYFHLTKLDQRVRHERLARVCRIEPGSEMAIVAEAHDPSGQPAIIGVARLTRSAAQPDAEVALLVADRVQGQGLGHEFMRRLVLLAREHGIRRLIGDMLCENDGMIGVARRAGFRIGPSPDDPQVFRAVLDLPAA